MVSGISTFLRGNEWSSLSPRPTTCLLASVRLVWLGLVGGKGSAPGCARCVTGALVEVEPRAPSQCANTWRPKLSSGI